MVKTNTKLSKSPIPFEGKVSIHERVIYQSVKRAMQGNIIMASVELITNAHDSYTRIGGNNKHITIVYKKDKFKCKFSIIDQAEGQSLADFGENFTKYWKPSDITEDNSQRGYFGKGAKDALGYMDEGMIASFKDGQFILCTLFFDDDHILRYKVLRSCKATYSLRQKHGGIKKNGTMVSFVADPRSDKDIKVPQFRTYQEEISNHYLLRKILQDESVKVTLINEKDRKKNRKRLFHVDPKGDQILDHTFNVEFGDYNPFSINMKVLRSDTVLGQKDRGSSRQGGLLVVDEKGVVLDISLFKYENDVFTDRFYGEVTINGFRKLLRDGEIVLSPERDGLVNSHQFVEKVTEQINFSLAKLVQEEKALMQRFDVTEISKDYQKRQSEFCKEFNKIAISELNFDEEELFEDGKIPSPINGFDIHPKSRSSKADANAVFSLIVDTNVVKPGTVIHLSSTNQSFRFHHKDNQLIVPKKKKGQQGSIVTRCITAFGYKAHESGKIIAKAPDRTAEAKLNITIPEDVNKYGVAFQYDNIIVTPNKPRKINLFASLKAFALSDKIKIESDNPNIHIDKKLITVVPEDDKVKGVLKYELEIWGSGEGQEGYITASCITASGWNCETILGIDVKDIKKNSNSSSSESVFNPHDYRTDLDPPQPASYSAEMEKVLIYTEFPTVKHYLGNNLENMYTLPAQIYIANLVMDRYFNQLAFKTIEKSGTVLSEINRHDAVQRKANEMMKLHGEKLLSILVDKKLMRKVIRDQRKVKK